MQLAMTAHRTAAMSDESAATSAEAHLVARVPMCFSTSALRARVFLQRLGEPAEGGLEDSKELAERGNRPTTPPQGKPVFLDWSNKRVDNSGVKGCGSGQAAELVGPPLDV